MSLRGASGISFLQSWFTGVPSGFILCIVKCSFPGNIVSYNCPDVTGALFCYEECSNYNFLLGDAQSFYKSSTKSLMDRRPSVSSVILALLSCGLGVLLW